MQTAGSGKQIIPFRALSEKCEAVFGEKARQINNFREVPDSIWSGDALSA